mmetsp:Transcript_12780/g.32206  ORF Transcript_12780/g.32206 Transcript_12780/m.32206 type:complete len:828 (+) Transcript_12780:113-2596(+)
MSLETEDIRVPNTASRAIQSQGRECQKKKQLPTTLSRWKPCFTACLQSSKGSGGPCDENGEGSFVLLDNVMESDTNDARLKDEAFCENLSRELDVFLDKLKPARTTGDRRADEIVGLLQSMGMQLPNPELESSHTKQQTDSVNTGVAIRGDKSVFISRKYRRRKSFAKKHPRLDRLISITSQTLGREFGGNQSSNGNKSRTQIADAGVQDSIRLDFSMTSVQLAIYPGDSKSGYRRHCDRENSCQQEGTKIGARKMSDRIRSTNPERLITCIYYVTEKDWDASLDGGDLRLFHSNDDDDNSDNVDSSVDVAKNRALSSHTDVTPFRDRMVIFRSDRVPHQVMPSHRRPRLAITMWFYGTLPNTLMKNEDGLSTMTSSDSNAAGGKKAVTLTTNGSCPIPPLPLHQVSHKNDESPSIFVSIASYRDSETRPTIDALYSTALKPRRIFAGIVAQLEQGEKDDEDIWTSITDSTKTWPQEQHQLRAMRLHARDATGPCYARGLCQSLYRGEDYVLQIDSHMRFRQNWDEYLIRSIKGLKDRRRKMSAGDEIEMRHCDKVMLTTYPVGYTLPNNIPTETRGTYLVPWKFDDQGMLRQRGRLVRRNCAEPTTTEGKECYDERLNSSTSQLGTEAKYDSSASRAHRQYLYAGGFNFGPSRLIFDVPYDTMGLHNLFFGEELSMAVRLFTHGYDLYAPEETVCYHLWSRSHRPTKSSTTPVSKTKVEEDNRLREMSQSKVKKQLIGDKTMVGTYCGLGKARSAAAFAHQLGVNFENQTFVRKGWECGALNSKGFVGNRDGNESLFPADCMEANVASLDAKTQSLIGMFLKGIQN